MDRWIEKNKTREEILAKYLCPFVNQELTLENNDLLNQSSIVSLSIYGTDKPIDSDWPINKKKYDLLTYRGELEKAIENVSNHLTKDFYEEAVYLINSHEYKALREKIAESKISKYSFFICPFGNKSVDHNYKYVIKPIVEKLQFAINRVDEISHNKLITEVILDSIRKSKFIIADLTDSRPNCYYELGYAHALGKPVIILAKEGTQKHFDISLYRWIFWIDYKDLKTKFEEELSNIIKSSKI
jgi:hypothetical protein